jgi:hypothetical protein
MNRCSFRSVRFALLYIVTRSKIVYRTFIPVNYYIMEPQTPIDVQRILDRKWKRTEYDKQLKLKRKIDWESLTAIDAE